MQEELERQTVAIVFNASRMTAQTLSNAMRRAMDAGLRELSRYRDNLHRQEPSGKMSVKELVGKGGSVDMSEIGEEGLKTFKKTAAKYGVDYAVYKEPLKDKQYKYYVFFQAKDTKVIHAAFEEYTAKMEQKRESVKEKLQKKQEIVDKKKEKARNVEKNRHKEIGR